MRRVCLRVGVVALFLSGSSAFAATQTWTGLGASWDTTADWSGTPRIPTSGDTAIFSNNLNTTVTFSTASTASSVLFTGAGTGAFTIGSVGVQSLTLSSAGVLSTDSTILNTETVDVPLIIGSATAGSYTFTSGATSSSNVLNIGGTVTGAASTGSTLLYLTGSNTGANTISGVVGDGVAGGKLGIVKMGSGTWVLSGANTYTGGTTVDGGTLNLNFTGINTGISLLSSGGAVTLGGSGTLSILGTNTSGQTTSQTIGGLTVNAGASAIVDTVGGSGLSSSLVLGAILRNTTAGATTFGGTLDFTLPATGSITTTTANISLTGGQQTILGGYATVGGTTWAVSGTGATAGAISGLTTYATGFTAGKDVDAATGTSAPGAMTINSLRFNSTGSYTVNLGGALIDATGGILETANVGNNAVSINNNTLTAANSGTARDIVVIQNNTLGALTISSQIINNSGAIGLTKSGAGTLIVSNANNTYTGQTTVNAGTLNLTGSLTGSNVFTTLNGTANFLENGSGSINGAAVTFEQGSLGTSTLDNANTYGGGTIVYGGTLVVGNTAALGATGAALTLGANAPGESTGTVDLATNSTVNAYNVTMANQTTSGAFTIVVDRATNGAATGPQTLGTLTFGSSNVLTVTAGANVTSGAVLAFSGNTLLNQANGGSMTFDPTTASVTLTTVSSGATGTHVDALVLDGTSTGNLITGAITDSGSVSNGAASVTKSNSSTWTLSGANTYVGATGISGGILEFANTSAMSAGSPVAVNSGGTLAVEVGTNAGLFTNSSSTTTNGSIGTLMAGKGGQGASVTWATGSFLGIDTTNAGGSFTYAGNITNAGVGLNKLGTGTLVLTGANTYTGATTVTAGTLQIGNGATAGSLTGSNVSTTGTGIVSESTAGVIGGTAVTFTQGSTGTTILDGTNTYGGATFINAGVLQVGGSGTTGTSGSLGKSGTIIFNGGTLQLTNNDSSDYSSRISTGTGTGAVSIDENGQSLNFNTALTSSLVHGFTLSDTAGGGELTFTRANAYIGATTINSGATLGLTASGTLGAATNALVINGGALDLGGVAATVGAVTLGGGGSTIEDSGNAKTLTTSGVSVNGTSNTIGASVTVSGAITQNASSALTVNGTAGTDALATSATLNGTGTLSTITLAGGNTVSSTGTLTTVGITVSGTGNTIGVGTVSGPITFNGASAAPAALNVSGTASGTVNVSAYATLSGTGATGAVTLASGGAINLTDGVIGTLTVGGLTTTGGGTLTFEIGANATGTDNIADTGTLSISGVTTIDIANVTGTTQSLTTGNYALFTYSGTQVPLSDFNLATGSLDSQNLSLTETGDVVYLTVASSGPPAQAYWSGASSASWATPSNFDTSAGGNTAVSAAPGSLTDVVFSTSSPIAANLSTTLDAATVINSLTFNSNSGNVTIASGSGGSSSTLTIDAATTTGSGGGINTSPNGITLQSGAGNVSISAPVVLGASQTWSNASGSLLTVSGQVSGAYALTTAGSGAIVLSNPAGNIYSGGTTVTAGTLFVNNAGGSTGYLPTAPTHTVTASSSTSGTGTGSVTVNGGTLAGSGTITPTSGTGVTVNAGATLFSGAAQTANGGVVNGTGITLNNSANLGHILTLNGTGTGTLSANLTFALGTDNTSGAYSGAGKYDFAAPSTNSTFMSVTGNTAGEINFALGSTESVTIMDVTGGATLALRLSTPYLLIAAGSDSDYANLVTAQGTGANTTYSLDGNGWVVGVATSLFTPGSILNPDEYNAITINQVGLNGAALTGDQIYAAPALYLENGDLEVVPEPGTWALMLGGLALLVFIQRRRNKLD